MSIKTSRTGFEIAVIGMAGAFPGAASIDEFWQNLVAGKDCIDQFTDDELTEAGVEPSLLDNPNYVRAKGVFPDPDKFDADFFDFTPADVAMMDPQMRMLHQGVYHALEDAGYASNNSGKKRNIGLFVGASGNFNWELDTFIQASMSSAGQFAALQLNDKDFAATRLAYKLNLHGPAISVHTACSTSLLAIDMACRHIFTGACRMAVAAGIGLSLPYKNGYGYEDGMIKSADGKCRAFADDANGTVEGNGMAAVMFKALEDAEEDGDLIYAIIRSSAINNDGERKVGYTAPSVEGQVEVIRRALFLAEIEADTISYVEAHGTGTNLGDPVEIEALKQAFNTEQKQFCGIGSLKSNIGHMDTAAGIGSFVKVVMALHHGTIPPTINVTQPNSRIDFANSPFFLVQETTPWQRKTDPQDPSVQLPLRAGVSSFGIGGTNVHAVLEEAPPLPSTGEPAHKPWQVLSLAAADRDALGRIQQQLAGYLTEHPNINPADLCWTWHTGRGGLPVRQAIVFNSVSNLSSALKAGKFSPELMAKDALSQSRVAFMFPGQGTQYAGMSRQLYQQLPDYAAALDACLAICDAQPGLGNVRNLLLAPVTDESRQQIAQTHMTQVCLFVVEYALAKTLMHYGIAPEVMIGHSLGEFVAATLAGVFTLENAIATVSLRGSLMQSMAPGAMLAVNATEAALAPLMNDNLSLAAVNGANQCTVAGTFAAIDTLSSQLTDQAVKHKVLKTSHAFHSFMMEPMLQEFGEFIASLGLQAPTLSYYSNVTGELISAEQATDPAYWQQHIRQAVRFHQGIQAITADPSTLLVEVGPGTVLTAFARQAAARAVRTVATLPGAASTSGDNSDNNSETGDMARFAQTLGDIQANGVNVDWRAWHIDAQSQHQPKKLRLPLYPFAKRSFSVGRGDVGTLLSGIEAGIGEGELLTASSEAAHTAAAPYSFAWQKALAPAQQYSEGVQPCLYFQTDGASKPKAPLINAVGGLRVSHVMQHSNPDSVKVAGNSYYPANLDSVASLRRLLNALRQTDDIPDLLILQCDLSRSLPGVALPKLQQRASNLCLALNQDYPNQSFNLLLLVQSKQTPDDAFEQQLALWQRQLQSGLNKITVRLLYLPTETKTPHILSLAKRLEREIFDEHALNPVIRLTQRERYSLELAADSHYRATSARFKQKTLALLVPQGYPVEPLQQRLQQASGAAVMPIEISLNQPIQPAITQTLEQITTGLQDTQLSWQEHYQLPDLSEAHKLVDEYCMAWAAGFLDPALGLKVGDTISRDSLITRLQLPEQLHRYADYFVHMWQQDGFIKPVSADPANASYTLIKAIDAVRAPGDIKRELNTITNLFDGPLRLMRHAIDSFPTVLNNEIQPIEVLYPDGANQMIQEIYTGSVQQVEDELIMSLFETLFQNMLKGVSSIRILEVGGGYGMAMRRIMPMMAHLKEVQFWFTDVGSTFITDAKQFALEQGYDHMTFGLFDIAKPAKNQGLPEGYFDLIYAYNVVHATKNIGQVTANLEPLLNDNGIFCLLERTNTRRYVDIPWGMADGWWHFDADERALSPLVSVAKWPDMFRNVPFKSVATYPTDAATRERTDVGLIIAQAQSGAARNINRATVWSHWHSQPEPQPWQARATNDRLHSTGEQSQPDAVLVLDTLLAGGPGAGGAKFEQLNGAMHPDLQAYPNYYRAAGNWINTQFRQADLRVAVLADGTRAEGAFHNNFRWQALSEFCDSMAAQHDGSPFSQQYVVPFSDALEGADATENWHHVPAVSDLHHVFAAMDSDWHVAVVQPAQCSMLSLPVSDEKSGTNDGTSNGIAGVRGDFTELVISLMKPLFGLDHIAPDDDFFALGGDSLKVAQLTTELEKHGIKIMPNEVFNFPKVSQLASYLHQNFGATARNVTSDEELVAHLQRQLGMQTFVHTFHIQPEAQASSEAQTVGEAQKAEAEKQIRILFADDAQLNADNQARKALLNELLALQLDSALQPHFVFPASALPLHLRHDKQERDKPNHSSMSQRQFDTLFRFSGITDAQLQQLVQQVQTAQRNLSSSIVSQPVETDYPISPFQKMYLKSDNRISLYQIEIDDIPDRELLNQAFLDVVRRQGLMRSSLQGNFLNQYRWLQHQLPESLSLPYLDLSSLDTPSREKAVEAMMAAEYDTDFASENGLLFHAVLIRHQLNQCTLLFNLDHSIFDNMSGQVLRRQLMNRYQALRAGSTVSMPPVRSFNDYLTQINDGPQGISSQQMIELFELEKFGESRLVVENHIVANRQTNIARLQYKVSLADWSISDDDQVAFEVTLSVLSYALARYFNIEHVPLKLIYQGRKYHDLAFFDTLGLFVDVVPLLIDTSGTPTEVTAGMNQKIQMLNRYNINFVNMAMNLGSLLKWRDVIGLTMPKKLAKKDPMILLNYAGKAGREYRKIIDFATSQMLNSPGKLDYASFYAIATSDDEHIVLDILCNFEPDMSRFEKVMNDALETVFCESSRSDTLHSKHKQQELS